MSNILLVKLSAIGDVIHALPVSYAIKETYPDAHLTWVAEPAAYELLKANPCIDELVLFKKKEFKTLRGFLKNYLPFRRLIRRRKYDLSLDLQGLFKSAAIIKTAGAKRRLGTYNMREFSDRISQPVIGPHTPKGHVVERYLDVARAAGCQVKQVVFPLKIDPKEADLARRILEQGGARLTTPYAVLVIGANWANKRWPAPYYARLADWLYQQKVVPVIVGSGPVDEGLVEEVLREADIPPINLVSRTNLRQLAWILGKAAIVIGGDTGALHLSAAMGAKTLMIMGRTEAKLYAPYGQTENAIEVDRPCRYCMKKICPLGLDCLAPIQPEQVTEKVRRLLAL